MRIISASEFGDNQTKYFDLADAKEEIIIKKRGRKQAYKLIPVEEPSDMDAYLSVPENMASIKRGIKQIETGEYSIIDPKNIWDSI